MASDLIEIFHASTAWLQDPVLLRTLSAVLSIVLLSAGVSKLLDRELFRYTLENYQILPRATLPAAAWCWPVLELMAGVALLWPAARVLGMVLGLVVLGGASMAVAWSLARGRVIECGCGSGGQKLSVGLLMRNAGLCAALVWAAQPGVQRPLGWLDALSVGGGVLVLLALYATLNQLLTNRHRLPVLKIGQR